MTRILLALLLCFVARDGVGDATVGHNLGRLPGVTPGTYHSPRATGTASALNSGIGQRFVRVGSARLTDEPTLAAVTRRISGTATWCAPTPRYCRGWGGTAMVAAVPSFRYGDEPYTVQVTGFYGGKASAVLVTVLSYCDCGSTVIDLSPHAFEQLAPLSVGRIRVIVDGVKSGRPIPVAPQTDVLP